MIQYGGRGAMAPLPSPGAHLHFASARRDGRDRPVHKGSTRRPVIWNRLDRRAAAKLFHQARAWDRRTHVAGRHGGRLGHAALQVLQCLIFDFQNFKTGQLDPSYEAIAAKANLARATVAAALQRLKRLGVLHWLRRCEESYEDGRYVLRQISNAYAVLPPSQWRSAGLLPAEAPTPAAGTWGDHPPLPGLVAQAADAGTVERAVATLDLDRTDRLAAALAKLGKAVIERSKP